MNSTNESSQDSGDRGSSPKEKPVKVGEEVDVTVSEFVVGNRPDSGAALHVVFAIPADRLTAVPDSARVVYPVAFRLYVVDRSGSVAARLDTARVFGARAPLASGSYLTGQLTVPVPPGAYHYRLLVQQNDGAAGNVVGGDSITVDTLTGRRFAVSDLVVGRAGSGLIWRTGGDTVFLNPLRQFPTGTSAELYYEVYGLPAGTVYHTVIRLEHASGRSVLGAIARVFGGGRRLPVLLEFDAPSDGPVTLVHRRLDLGDAQRGGYVLVLQISDPATGIAVTRREAFSVVTP